MDHDGKLTWTSRRGCRNTNLVRMDESFATPWTAERSLSVVQEIARHRPGHAGSHSPHVYGEIVLRPVEKDEDASVDVQVMTNDEAIEVEIVAERDNQDIKVIVPSDVHWDDTHEGPCVQISITVSAPRNATLSSLSLSSVQLDILLEKSLAVHLNNPLLISSVSGSISTPSLSASEGFASPAYTLGGAGCSIGVGTVSGGIDGWFPLYDALHARSVSGSVRLNVTPQAHRLDGGDKRDAPSILNVSSQSGSLLVNEGIEDAATRELMPHRDYQVDMKTSSGQITARAASSTKTRITSLSGDLDVALYPMVAKPGSSRQVSEFHTENVSGPTRVLVLGTTTPRDLELFSRHVSVSGGLRLRYADSWDGSIEASGVSAKVTVRGRDVVIDERKNGPGGWWAKQIKAHKGDPADGRIVASGVSGEIDVLIGDE